MMNNLEQHLLLGIEVQDDIEVDNTLFVILYRFSANKKYDGRPQHVIIR